MSTESEEEYQSRCRFQGELDRAFPRGGICAVLDYRDGRFHSIGVMEATGRLFCSGTRRSQQDNGWEYEILIDSRKRNDAPDHEIRVWVRGLAPHPSAPGLWEAAMADVADERLLRVSTNTQPADRPTARMRTAVTKAHERQLFPAGV